MNKLAILGASGHGKVVADISVAAGWNSVTFFDDAWPEISRNGAWNVAGDTALLLSKLSEFDGVVIAIGNCVTRWEKQQYILKTGGSMVTVVHPMAYVSPHAKLGTGVVVMAGAVINTDAEIGDGCIINTGAIIEHDCQLEHAVHVAPGAVLSGDVSVASCSWIGVGAVARQGARIGERVTVGAGAVVINQINDGLTVVGCPAKPLTKKI